MRFRWGPTTATLMMVAALVVVPAGVAAASCAPPIPVGQAINEAHAVFVGTVTGLEYDGRLATFAVDDVWKGDLGATAVVTGGPRPSELAAAEAEGQSIVTSVDRNYEMGVTYLVVAHGLEEGVLLDNGCSQTQPYSGSLADFRPAGSTPPPPPSDSGLDVAGWVGIAAVAIIIVGGVVGAAIWFRRRRVARSVASH